MTATGQRPEMVCSFRAIPTHPPPHPPPPTPTPPHPPPRAGVFALAGDQAVHLLWRLAEGEGPEGLNPKVGPVIQHTRCFTGVGWGVGGGSAWLRCAIGGASHPVVCHHWRGSHPVVCHHWRGQHSTACVCFHMGPRRAACLAWRLGRGACDMLMQPLLPSQKAHHSLATSLASPPVVQVITLMICTNDLAHLTHVYPARRGGRGGRAGCPH